VSAVRRNDARMRIYSDRSFLPSGVPHVPMLYPFWGVSEIGETEQNRQRLDRYRHIGSSLFELTTLERADIAVLPFDWEFTRWTKADFFPATREFATAFVARANAAGVPIVIFYESDVVQEVPVDGALVFASSLYRSTRRPNEVAMPAWTEDLLSTYAGGRVSVRKKRGRPTVGFCGYAPPLGMPWGRPKLKELARWALARTGLIRLMSVIPASYPRVQAIRLLGRGSQVDTNFLIRPYVMRPNRSTALSHSNRALPSASDESHADATSKREFFDNMMDSDYVLCSRGFGNYSYRLYEALACGRIPLFIDTDCVLPYDFAIDWKRYCVWVAESELGSIADRVSDFHQALSPGEFEELQLACRRLWEDWIGPEAFFARFDLHLGGAGLLGPK
jgi:hypothetical protein